MPSRRKQQQEATRDDSANENEDSVVDPSRDSTAEPDGFASDSSEEGRPSRNTGVQQVGEAGRAYPWLISLQLLIWQLDQSSTTLSPAPSSS